LFSPPCCVAQSSRLVTHDYSTDDNHTAVISTVSQNPLVVCCCYGYVVADLFYVSFTFSFPIVPLLIARFTATGWLSDRLVLVSIAALLFCIGYWVYYVVV
jgi:hypothetical protein